MTVDRRVQLRTSVDGCGYWGVVMWIIRRRSDRGNVIDRCVHLGVLVVIIWASSSGYEKYSG
jgi:hypothetical protein